VALTTELLGSHSQGFEVQDGFVKPILTAASIRNNAAAT